MSSAPTPFRHTAPWLQWVGLPHTQPAPPGSSCVPAGPSCLGLGLFLALNLEPTHQQLLMAQVQGQKAIQVACIRPWPGPLNQ